MLQCKRRTGVSGRSGAVACIALALLGLTIPLHAQVITEFRAGISANAQAVKDGVAHDSAPGPFGERHFGDEFGFDPIASRILRGFE